MEDSKESKPQVNINSIKLKSVYFKVVQNRFQNTRHPITLFSFSICTIQFFTKKQVPLFFIKNNIFKSQTCSAEGCVCQGTYSLNDLHISLHRLLRCHPWAPSPAHSMNENRSVSWEPYFTVDGQNPAPPGMVKTPINNGMIIILGGAGFCSSTVVSY